MDSEGLLEKLVCVRLVDHIRKDGKLKALNLVLDKEPSLRYMLEGINPDHRLTVHFSLNYCYRTYTCSALGKKFRWDNKKYGILIPLKSLIESGQVPVNLHSADTFFLSEVSLTDDSRIVNGPNIVEKVKDEMQDMGFEYMDGITFGWRPKYRDQRKILSGLAKELEITSVLHYKTIFGVYERALSTVENWRRAIDWESSDDPEIIEFYNSQGRVLNEAHDKLVGILGFLPNKRMRKEAQKAIRNLESNYSFDNPLFPRKS